MNIQRNRLNVLFLEGSRQDIELIEQKLKDECECPVYLDACGTKEEYLRLIKRGSYDVILADYALPGFSAEEALKLTMSVCPKVPFICVSGTIGEDTAVELLKQGASDYVLKDRLGRLSFAVSRAIEQAEERGTRRETLTAAEDTYRLILDSHSRGGRHVRQRRDCADGKPVFGPNVLGKQAGNVWEQSLPQGSPAFLQKNLSHVIWKSSRKRMIREE